MKRKRSGYPKRFVDSIIRDFEEKQSRAPQESENSEEIITYVPIRIPFCEKNGKLVTRFHEKLKSFAGNDFKLSVIWQSKKLKYPIIHKANVIYKEKSSLNLDVTYIGETKLVAEKRRNQHEKPFHDSSKYITYR